MLGFGHHKLGFRPCLHCATRSWTGTASSSAATRKQPSPKLKDRSAQITKKMVEPDDPFDAMFDDMNLLDDLLSGSTPSSSRRSAAVDDDSSESGSSEVAANEDRRGRMVHVSPGPHGGSMEEESDSAVLELPPQQLTNTVRKPWESAASFAAKNAAFAAAAAAASTAAAAEFLAHSEASKRVNSRQAETSAETAERRSRSASSIDMGGEREVMLEEPTFRLDDEEDLTRPSGEEDLPAVSTAALPAAQGLLGLKPRPKKPDPPRQDDQLLQAARAAAEAAADGTAVPIAKLSRRRSNGRAFELLTPSALVQQRREQQDINQRRAMPFGAAHVAPAAAAAGGPSLPFGRSAMRSPAAGSSGDAVVVRSTRGSRSVRKSEASGDMQLAGPAAAHQLQQEVQQLQRQEKVTSARPRAKVAPPAAAGQQEGSRSKAPRGSKGPSLRGQEGSSQTAGRQDPPPQEIMPSNWRAFATSSFPKVYDPGWHSSLLEFLADLWPAVGKAHAGQGSRVRGGTLSAQTRADQQELIQRAYQFAQLCWRAKDARFRLGIALSFVENVLDHDGMLEECVRLLPKDMLAQGVVPLFRGVHADAFPTFLSLARDRLGLDWAPTEEEEEGQPWPALFARLKELQRCHPEVDLTVLAYLDWQSNIDLEV